jgi:hypothetical protein
MKNRCAVLAVMLAIPWTVATADADPRVNGRGVAGRAGAGRSTHAFGSSAHTHGQFVHRGFGAHRFSPRRFVPFAVLIAPPVAVYSSPSVFDAPPPYYGPAVSSPAMSAPPAVYGAPVYGAPAPMPPAPPPPRVVEYPTGRYELRGDGIGTPYNWVWIPNPPPPPTAPPTAVDASPPSRTPVYRWIDGQGVVHWPNRSDKIPRQYRESS